MVAYIISVSTVVILLTETGAFKTRYDYNLTIMKFPKPAIDNRF